MTRSIIATRLGGLLNAILSELCTFTFPDHPTPRFGMPGTREVEKPRGYRETVRSAPTECDGGHCCALLCCPSLSSRPS